MTKHGNGSDPRTQRAYRNDFIKSHAIEYNDVMKDEGERIDDSAWLENYLDNRNGDTSQRGKWAKRFVRIEGEIQGMSPVEEFLNAQLWYGIHDKELGLISESDYVNKIRDLQNKYKRTNCFIYILLLSY